MTRETTRRVVDLKNSISIPSKAQRTRISDFFNVSAIFLFLFFHSSSHFHGRERTNRRTQRRGYKLQISSSTIGGIQNLLPRYLFIGRFASSFPLAVALFETADYSSSRFFCFGFVFVFCIIFRADTQCHWAKRRSET